MAGINHTVERSYSPVFRPRKLADDDDDEIYVERIAEIALEMDQALDYMKDVGVFLKDKEDTNLLGDCKEITQKAIDEHFDVLDELNEELLKQNDEADDHLQMMLEYQRSLGYEVQDPVLSIEG